MMFGSDVHVPLRMDCKNFSRLICFTFTEISLTVGWITMRSGADICGIHRRNPADSVDPLDSTQSTEQIRSFFKGEQLWNYNHIINNLGLGTLSDSCGEGNWLRGLSRVT